MNRRRAAKTYMPLYAHDKRTSRPMEHPARPAVELVAAAAPTPTVSMRVLHPSIVVTMDPMLTLLTIGKMPNVLPPSDFLSMIGSVALPSTRTLSRQRGVRMEIFI